MAVLRRSDQADTRDNGLGTGMVARAESREMGPTAWMDEAAGRSRKRCRLAVGPRDFSTATRCTGHYGNPRRRGAATADSGEPSHAPADRRADRGRSRQDGEPDQ